MNFKSVYLCSCVVLWYMVFVGCGLIINIVFFVVLLGLVIL